MNIQVNPLNRYLTKLLEILLSKIRHNSQNKLINDIMETKVLLIKVIKSRKSPLLSSLDDKQLQLCQMNVIPLLRKPYVNEVTLKEQK